MRGLICRAAVAALALAAVGCMRSIKQEPVREATVHVFSTGEEGMYTNTYLVETRGGVVAIDAPMLLRDAKELRKRIEATGKPLRAVLLTGATPDHYNGIAELLRDDVMFAPNVRQVPVISTARVAQELRADAEKMRTRGRDAYGKEWPSEIVYPTRRLQTGEFVEIDGVYFTAYDLGRGATDADTAWLMSSTHGTDAFVGDLVFHELHADTSRGRTAEWIQSLRNLRESFGDQLKAVYPGHGTKGSVWALDWQREYLERYRNAVRELADGRPQLAQEDTRRLEDELDQLVPDGKLRFQIARGANAVAAELAAMGGAGEEGTGERRK